MVRDFGGKVVSSISQEELDKRKIEARQRTYFNLKRELGDEFVMSLYDSIINIYKKTKDGSILEVASMDYANREVIYFGSEYRNQQNLARFAMQMELDSSVSFRREENSEDMARADNTLFDLEKATERLTCGGDRVSHGSGSRMM